MGAGTVYGLRSSVNKTVKQVRCKCHLAGGFTVGPAMTEYIVKEIGHQWIVYADRRSIAGCADEASALKLIAEHCAANKATCKATQAKTHQREPAGDT